MQSSRQTPAATDTERAAWPLIEWCRLVGISRALFYKFGEDRIPQTVHLGRRKRLVLESPSAWAKRMAAQAAGDHRQNPRLPSRGGQHGA